MTATLYTTVQAGRWEDASTWDAGAVPSATDAAALNHQVTVETAVTIGLLLVGTGGGISYPPSKAVGTTASLTVTSDILYYGDQATGTVRTDGIKVSVTPGLYCTVQAKNGLPRIEPLANGTDVIFSDPGYISAGATMQDIKPEGCAQAYARKVSNNVRYATLDVRVRASKVQLVGKLLRMADSPYTVLLATDTYLLKGYVETVATDASSVGKEFIVYKVTVAEAL